MTGKFTLTGKVQQVTKDGADGGIDQDKTVLTGWTATLTSNYPKGVPLPDGSDVDYVDQRDITLLSDGSITEDGTNAGISLTAHDPAVFATPLQWTIKPGTVTLTSGTTMRPKAWTFNAPLDGTSVTLGGLTPVVGMPLQPAPDSVPWDSITGKPSPSAASAVYATMAALKAATVSTTGFACVQGYYAAGDGGGGWFRWDSTDTTSTDNGGTIITPTGGLASSGRWKRVYEGAVNVRWFGVNPSQTDNTPMMVKCAAWVCGLSNGGTMYIPSGYYPHQFSGVTTISINADNILIFGDGPSSDLAVTGSHGQPSQVGYFFTFSSTGRGQGGGIRDIRFYGNSKLKWGAYIPTWRNAVFRNVSAIDVHGGALDFESNHTTLYGESITVSHVDHTTTVGTAITQYGVRFRTGSSTSSKQWTDCKVENLDIISCWDSGLVLDGCQRFTVSNITAANNETHSDTIDGSSKTGCLHAVRITNTVGVTAGPSGFHSVDSVYLESGAGGETPGTNVAVLVEAMNVAAQIQQNRISNVRGSTDSVGQLKLVDNSGFGRLLDTMFSNPKNTPAANIITIGAAVTNTDLLLPATRDWSAAVSDSGTNTLVNGVSPAYVVLPPVPAAYDSFTGANSSSVDSGRWNTSVGAGSGAAVNIQGNAAQLKTGATGGYSGSDDVSLSSTLATTLTDVDLVFCLTSSSVTVESYLLVGVRSSNVIPFAGTTAYALQIAQFTDGSSVATVIKRVSSSNTTLYTSGGATMTNGQKTWYRFRVKGTSLKLWTWADGTAMPTATTWSATDTGVTAGGSVTFALRAGNAAASGIQKIDNAAIYAL